MAGAARSQAALRRGRSSIPSSRGRAASPGRALKIDNLHSLCPNARRTDQGTPRRPARPTLIRANLTLRNVVVDPALLYSLIRAARAVDRDVSPASREIAITGS